MTVPMPIAELPLDRKAGQAKITLYADGSWDGDLEAFQSTVGERAMVMTRDWAVIMWLVINALRRETLIK